jgi:hypothetical protein
MPPKVGVAALLTRGNGRKREEDERKGEKAIWTRQPGRARVGGRCRRGFPVRRNTSPREATVAKKWKDTEDESQRLWAWNHGLQKGEEEPPLVGGGQGRRDWTRKDVDRSAAVLGWYAVMAFAWAAGLVLYWVACRG